MENEKSTVRSVSVNLGTTHVSPFSADSVSRRPWVLLICSDLGFRSERPERISAATLREKIAAENVTLCGTVDQGLPDDIAPFHVEYRIHDLRDFSVASLRDRIPILRKLGEASLVLERISERKTDPGEGFRLIAGMQPPPSVMRHLAACLPGGSAPPPAGPSASAIDSILSMMDVGQRSGETENISAQPGDFVAALAGEGTSGGFSSAALRSCRDYVKDLTDRLSISVVNQPFFRSAACSWNALKVLLKAAGRDPGIHFYLHSSPADTVEGNFADALSACASETGVPDIVVWDYPVAVTTAGMERLDRIARQADRFKTAVIASLDRGDALYRSILESEPLRTIIGKDDFIPLRRLQQATQARCLALCAPDAALDRGGGAEEIPVGGAWLFALQWVASLTGSGTPFHLHRDSTAALDGLLFPHLTEDTISDASEFGITLMSGNGCAFPRVLIEDRKSPFGSLLFNLAVNRAARITAEWIGKRPKEKCDEAAPALERFLRTELEPYHILSSAAAVAVTASGQQSLSISIDSTSTIAGFPVRFDFSFNCLG